MADPHPLLEVCDLSKRYGAKTVLDRLDLAVGAGRCLALLGHNGAGKTTLIKLLLGLTKPSRGLVRLLGQDPRGPDGFTLRRSLGFLPEVVSFPPGLTGQEVIRFYANLKGCRPQEGDRLLQQLGLEDASLRRVKTYSKGMRQRLGLAQALLGDPRLLFLDEPTNGLDPPLRRQFYDVVKMATSTGVTAVISSHSLTEIEAKADLAAILTGGRLAAFGTLADLRIASGLPFKLRAQVAPEAVGNLAEAMGDAFILEQVQGGTVYFRCPQPDKMAILKHVAKLNGLIEDLDVLPPRLEEVYDHFVGQGRVT